MADAISGREIFVKRFFVMILFSSTNIKQPKVLAREISHLTIGHI
jgi:hypothetical protein